MTNFTIDSNKYYSVKILAIEPYFQVAYRQQSLRFTFFIEELDQATPRTVSIPKKYPLSDKSIFKKYNQIISDGENFQHLLKKPKRLASELMSHAERKLFRAKLSISKSKEFINIESLEKGER